MAENLNARLEAFCDGVFAIAMTLLIIEIKLPTTPHIETTRDFWRALGHLAPSFFAFLLSFVIILITWVNHHTTIRLVNKTSHPFLFANGLLLLTVVVLPFPTGLLGEHLMTDHAAPAVILYSGVCALQAVGWNLLTRTILAPSRLLTRNEKATFELRSRHQYSYYAFALYSTCAVVAIWLPKTVAVAISLSWLVWIVAGINEKDE